MKSNAQRLSGSVRNHMGVFPTCLRMGVILGLLTKFATANVLCHSICHARPEDIEFPPMIPISLICMACSFAGTTS